MAVCTEGLNKEGHEVYLWSRWLKDRNYNAIYDDMPMEGWWPGPKKEASYEGKGLLVKEESLI